MRASEPAGEILNAVKDPVWFTHAELQGPIVELQNFRNGEFEIRKSAKTTIRQSANSRKTHYSHLMHPTAIDDV